MRNFIRSSYYILSHLNVLLPRAYPRRALTSYMSSPSLYRSLAIPSAPGPSTTKLSAPSNCTTIGNLPTSSICRQHLPSRGSTNTQSCSLHPRHCNRHVMRIESRQDSTVGIAVCLKICDSRASVLLPYFQKQ